MLVGTDLFGSTSATVDGLSAFIIGHAAECSQLFTGHGHTGTTSCVRGARGGHARHESDLGHIPTSRATDGTERSYEQEEDEELKSTHFASRCRLVPVRVDELAGAQSTRIVDSDQSVGHLACYSLRVEGVSTGLLHGHRGIVRKRERALPHMAGLSQRIP